ncbi:unnamed protein product [Debaryomyces tyrocola]|nr:unnamed protein product [Debaryomyces tyrocola]
MTNDLLLCRQLNDIIIEKPNVTFKIIQLIPATEGASDPFTTFRTDENTLDIGLTKKTYLSIFKEAHIFWHNNLVPYVPKFEEYWHNDREKLINTYYMTLGYLLTTNENHTIIRLHELTLWQIWKTSPNSRQFLLSEFEILTVLISSRLKRINKSSSLWLMVKKIAIALIFHEIVNAEVPGTIELYQVLVSRILKSCEIHFANYYASGFLKWCIRFNFILYKNTDSTSIRASMVEMNAMILNNLVQLCHQKLTDVSLWTTLEVYLRECNRKLSSSEHTIDEYNMIIDQLTTLGKADLIKINTLTEKVMAEFDVQDFQLQQINWLLKANCSALSPYVALMAPLPVSSQETSLQLQTMISFAYKSEKEQLNNFEETTGGNTLYNSKAKFASVLHHLLLKDIV